MDKVASKDFNPEVGIIIGTRPSIVMAAPVIQAFDRAGLPNFVVHSGQHYSDNMDAQFFRDFNLRDPDYRLPATSDYKTHGSQTGYMLVEIEKILMERRPRAFIVLGDTNTNLAGALAARKLHMHVCHLEAGERSHDWRSPEEHNRVMIDHISDMMFATNEKSKRNLLAEGKHHVGDVDMMFATNEKSKRNLLAEGISEDKIHITGNPIVDAAKLKQASAAERADEVLARFEVNAGQYAVMTMHREENVDTPEILKTHLDAVREGSRKTGVPVLFLAHPRTMDRMARFGFMDEIEASPEIIVKEAAGYTDFLALLINAKLAITDSGGVQQEACIMGVPAVTLMVETPWPETVECNANIVAYNDLGAIVNAIVSQAGAEHGAWTNPFGDGTTGQQVTELLRPVLESAKG